MHYPPEWNLLVVVALIFVDIILWWRLYRTATLQRDWCIVPYTEPYVGGPALFGKDRNVNDPPHYTLNGLLTLSDDYREILRDHNDNNLAYAIVVMNDSHTDDFPMNLLMWRVDNAIIPRFHNQLRALVTEYYNRHDIHRPYAIIRSGLCPINKLLESETMNLSYHGIFLPWIFYVK